MFKSIGEIQNKINLKGRCAIYNGKLNADWVAAGFECSFVGNSIRVFFETEAHNTPVYVCCETDGQRQKIAVSSSSEVLVIDGLEYGSHDFSIMRVTEVFSPKNNVTDYLFITGIDLGDGELEDKKIEKRKRIDFYGDSITNAWASLADPDSTERRQCDNDFSISYANLTAKALNAEANVCAVSGHGIICSHDGNRSEPMSMFYNMQSRYLPLKTDFAEKPDLIVIALGTNDTGGNTSNEEMGGGMKKFISLLRRTMPETPIVWIYGMMNEYYVPMMTELIDKLSKDDKNVYFLPFKAIKRENNETGAFGHPNIKAQKAIAEKLTNYILEKGFLN